MKQLPGDAELLLRAEGRCGALALELDRLERSVAGAVAHAGSRWSGRGAAAFGGSAGEHRRTVRDVRAAVERMGLITRGFAHELADAQAAVRRLPEGSVAEREVIEERVNLLRNRFRRQLGHIEADLTQLLLRRPEPPPGRWTGPVLPPGGWRTEPTLSDRWTGPVRPPGGWRNRPPLNGRWTGPVLPPGVSPADRPSSHRFVLPPTIRPLPTPADRNPGAAQLPWTPPWLNGSGGASHHVVVQPVGIPA